MTRKICVVTGTRAEYGLLKWLMKEIRASDGLVLQVVATGAHLSPDFGLTYREIIEDGFTLDAAVEMLLSSDTPVGISKSMGLGLIGFAEAFSRLAPDMVLLLGDRYEMLAAATAAMIGNIPIAHLHGGETTEGAFDEAIRHSITKMSHLHFVAAEPYRRRVIQLGESPDRVFLVGGLGVDAIGRVETLDRQTLEQSLDFSFGPRNLLVTFHPVTLEGDASKDQMGELLAALATLDQTHLIFTLPNADNGNRAITRQIQAFVAAHPHARAYSSLGQLRYFSCLKFVDGVIGNSSSGLAEAPSFRVGTVNIGSRQRGRLRAASVIDCAPSRDEITKAIQQLYDESFRELLARTTNPYGDGGAASRITRTLESVDFQNLVQKRFIDWP